MMKRSSFLWVGIMTLVLAGCGGSSSSDEPILGIMFPIDDDGPVTMPDGTVVDRPNVEEIRPDAVPIEMEVEYEQYVRDTLHLRDPRGNVYEIVSVNERGVEERSYLIITPEYRSIWNIDTPGWGYDTAYVLKGQGECYARATSSVPNATLYGRSVFYNKQDEANGGAGAYRLKLDLLDTKWEVSWQLGEYGLIDRIVLLNSDDEIVASASRDDDEHLDYQWVDRGDMVSVRLPFEPLRWNKDIEYDPASFLERACQPPPYAGDALDYRIMLEDKSRNVVYAQENDDDVVHFHFSRVHSDEWDALMQGNDREGEATLIALQMFTQGHDEYRGVPCIQEPGKRAVVYFNGYRFDGLYAEWYDALDGEDRERRMLEGLTFDEDGYLIKSSSGVFTPTSHTDVDWLAECRNYDRDFD